MSVWGIFYNKNILSLSGIYKSRKCTKLQESVTLFYNDQNIENLISSILLPTQDYFEVNLFTFVHLISFKSKGLKKHNHITVITVKKINSNPLVVTNCQHS